MTLVLAASAGLLLGLAVYAWTVYAGAVALGHRAYTHVVLATTFVIAVEWVATSSVEEHSPNAWLLLAANVAGIGAMLALANRFR